jgi:hypothetical protein
LNVDNVRWVREVNKLVHRAWNICSGGPQNSNVWETLQWNIYEKWKSFRKLTECVTSLAEVRISLHYERKISLADIHINCFVEENSNICIESITNYYLNFENVRIIL